MHWLCVLTHFAHREWFGTKFQFASTNVAQAILFQLTKSAYTKAHRKIIHGRNKKQLHTTELKTSLNWILFRLLHWFIYYQSVDVCEYVHVRVRESADTLLDRSNFTLYSLLLLNSKTIFVIWICRLLEIPNMHLIPHGQCIVWRTKKWRTERTQWQNNDMAYSLYIHELKQNNKCI